MGTVLALPHPWVHSLTLNKLDVVVHASNRSTKEMGAGGSEVQDRLWLHSKLEASLGYIKPFLTL